jgi:ParB-like nuclease domain
MAVTRATVRRTIESGALDDCFSSGSAKVLLMGSKVKTDSPEWMSPGGGFNHFVGIVQSIERSGYDAEYPVLVNQWGEVVDGHHRMAACRLLSVEPVQRIVRRKHRHWCCRPCTCGETT